jgi:hypothetical protein
LLRRPAAVVRAVAADRQIGTGRVSHDALFVSRARKISGVAARPTSAPAKTRAAMVDATVDAAHAVSSAESYPSSGRYITALNSLLCRFTAARAAL